MADKTIITCAVTGNITKPEQHPDLPITPEQIADARRSMPPRPGAAIAHIHVRDPKTGAPSMELAHYREVVERIRASATDLIINLTTGPGGRFVPSDDDPKVAAPGSTLVRPERRVEHVVALRPEICSLDLNTMWFGSARGDQHAAQRRDHGRGRSARRASCRSSRCSIPATSSSPISCSRTACWRGRPCSSSCSGSGTAFRRPRRPCSTPDRCLPADAMWAAMGIGRMEFPIVAQACLLGGHVRVGLEDNLYLEQGRARALQRGAGRARGHIVELLGRSVATPPRRAGSWV